MIIQFKVQYSDKGQFGFANNLNKIYRNIETIDNYLKINLKSKLDKNKGFEEIIEVGKFIIFLGIQYTDKNERYGIMNFHSIELGEDYFYRINKVDGRYVKDKANDKMMDSFYNVSEKISEVTIEVELVVEPDDNVS